MDFTGVPSATWCVAGVVKLWITGVLMVGETTKRLVPFGDPGSEIESNILLLEATELIASPITWEGELLGVVLEVI